ncbi:exodeoxyribonuclease V subunit alpha [Alteromonas sp. CYL-A6]|uniref:exodeoxyribonuclease V subunit alpha n=1 Tax=Alteromonas nitratireducens TaxID=3390813 RepID=UPI0034BDAD41
MMTLDHALTRLPGSEAIDYYFSRTFAVPTLSDADAQVWQQLLILLSWQLRQGHTCLSLNEVADKTWFRQADVADSGFTLPDSDRLLTLARDALNHDVVATGLILDDALLYTRRYYAFEQEVIGAITARRHYVTPEPDALARCHAVWQQMFDCQPQSEQDWQQVAVAASLLQPFSVINGGPGTGKTYTVTRLLLALQAMSDHPLNIVLAAPTGKAAQRLSESVGSARDALRGKVDEQLLTTLPEQAVTLHRLLGVSQYGIDTRFHADNPLDLDVLIVDEASMVDIGLMARVVRALPAQARLFLVGDADQLPAVESGNVLEALITPPDENAIASGRGVPRVMREHIAALCPHLPLLAVDDDAPGWVHTLSRSQRFGGALARAAAAIRSGDVSAFEHEANTHAELPEALSSDVSLCPLPAAATALTSLIRQTLSALLEARSVQEAIEATRACRWLTPVRKGPFGAQALNSLMEQVVRDAVKAPDSAFFRGRMLMVTQNNYAQQLFNGDIGIVWPDASGSLKAWFERADGSIRAMNLSRLPAVESAFAMTIHKSQGSEFSQVVMVIPPSQSQQIQSLYHRGLLYTGLTRAKSGCLILSDNDTLEAMMTRRDSRFSGLRQRLHSA